MSDLLISGLPEHVVAAVDVSAQELGLSRNEFLLGVLSRVAQDRSRVTSVDFQDLSATFSDLLRADVMKDAWS